MKRTSPVARFALFFLFCSLAGLAQANQAEKVPPKPPTRDDSLKFRHVQAQVVAYQDRHLDTALFFAHRAYELAWGLQQPQWVAQAGWQLARISHRLGDYPAALKHLHEVMPLLKQAGHPRHLAELYHDLGLTSSQLSHQAQAAYYFRSAYQIYQAERLPAEASLTLQQLGQLFLAQNELDSAQQYLQTGLQLAQQSGQLPAMAQALTQLGALQLARQAYAKATDDLRPAMQLVRLGKLEATPAGIETALYLAQAHYHQGQYDSSYTYAALATVPAPGLSPRLQAQAHTVMASCWAALGQFQSAWQSERRAKLLSDSLGQAHAQTAVQQTHTLLDANRQEQQLAILRVNEQALQARQRLIERVGVAATGTLLFILVVLLVYSRRESRAKRLLASQKAELEAQKEQIEAQADLMTAAHREIKVTNLALGEALAEIARTNRQLLDTNEELEAKVEQRTAILMKQNDQLRAYGQLNAHKLRSPVATIMGISYLLMRSRAIPDADYELVAALDTTIKKLDGVVHNLQTLTREVPYAPSETAL
jgi:tetratricopeptide (TPR) repeat protein